MNISRIDYLRKHENNPLEKQEEVDYRYRVLGKSKVLVNREECYQLLSNKLSGNQGIYLGSN